MILSRYLLHFIRGVEARICSKEYIRTMRMTPTAAIKAILGLPPLHLHLEAEAKAGIYRLDCNNQWNSSQRVFGHAGMTWKLVREPIQHMGTEKMIPRCVCDISFTFRFPDRCDWKDGLWTDRKEGLIWYTDDS